MEIIWSYLAWNAVNYEIRHDYSIEFNNLIQIKINIQKLLGIPLFCLFSILYLHSFMNFENTALALYVRLT